MPEKNIVWSPPLVHWEILYPSPHRYRSFPISDDWVSSCVLISILYYSRVRHLCVLRMTWMILLCVCVFIMDRNYTKSLQGIEAIGFTLCLGRRCPAPPHYTTTTHQYHVKDTDYGYNSDYTRRMILCMCMYIYICMCMCMWMSVCACVCDKRHSQRRECIQH